MVTPERLMQFTFGFAPPLIIEAAIRHRVFDVLDAGAKTADTVCAETRTSERGMGALLNALVGLELLAKDHEGRYALTAESATFSGERKTELSRDVFPADERADAASMARSVRDRAHRASSPADQS